MRDLERLTKKGIYWLEDHYDEFKEDPLKVSDHILSTDSFVEPVNYGPHGVQLQIDEAKTFVDRRDFGEFLAEQLRPLGMKKYDDDGLWVWLGLVYVNQILHGPGSAGKVMAIERWVPPSNTRSEHKHLVRGPAYICERYADSDDVKQLLLAGYALTTNGDVYNEVCARKAILRTPSIMRAMPHLYLVDGKVKQGATKRGGSPGTVDRMVKYIKQLSRTFYLDDLTTEQFLEMLPAEYDRWKS